MTTATRPLRASRSRSKPSNAVGSRSAARKITSEFTAGQRVRVNDDVEIGVRLGEITRSNNYTTAWFLPQELAAVEVGQRRPVGVCGLADAADEQMPALNELRAS